MKLEGRKIVLLVDDLYQEMEVWVPYYRLKEAGLNVQLVGPQAGITCKSKFGYPAKADTAYASLNAQEADGVIIPGGYAPDKMRRHPKVNKFVAEMDKAGKLVAAICHGPWVLCSANGMLRGRKATCFMSIKDDLVNAGAEWVDEAAAVDRNLVTSRTPDDLPAFCKACLEVLAAQ